MGKKSSVSTEVLFLKVSLAIMFLAIGITGIADYNSDSQEFWRGVNEFFGQSNSALPLIMAIIELVAGALLLLSLFDAVPKKTISVFILIICIYWLVRIILVFFANNFTEPNFLTWISRLAPQLVALSALWILYRSES